MKVKNIFYIILSLTLFILGCSKNNSKSDGDFKKNYTIKIVDPSSKEGMQRALNELYETKQALYYSLQMSYIEAEQKQSNFEYELKKTVIESKSIGVDWKEKCKLIRIKQKDELIAYREMRKIDQDMLNDATKKYKDLYAKYNIVFGKNPTNEVEQVYSEELKNPESDK